MAQGSSDRGLRERARALLIGVGLPALVVVALILVFSGGGDGDPVATTIPVANVAENPSFEAGVRGWAPSQARLRRRADGEAPNGRHAGLLVASSERPYSLDDEGASVEDAVAGQVYTGRAFVRAGRGAAGRGVTLTVRELDGERVVGSRSVAVVPGPGSYSYAVVEYAALRDGDRLELELRRDLGVIPGESIYVDALSLAPAEVVLSDTARVVDPVGIWGRIDCQETTRQERLETGGDASRTADGKEQGNSAFRRLTIRDGDDVSGERCELGENDHLEGPTAVYREGRRVLTFISVRVPSPAAADGKGWQTVFQVKQAQPSDGGEFTSPVIAMHLTDGRWQLEHVEAGTIWSAPVEPGRWTRFVLDEELSQEPGLGLIRLSADLDGDGDFLDPGERFRQTGLITLGTEVDGPNGDEDGLGEGEPIPGHLRAGLYHCDRLPGSANACPETPASDPWPCPAPGRGPCAIDLDNVQIAIVRE